MIPIDFPDLKGDLAWRSRVDEQMQLLSEYFFSVSEGRFKVEWVIADNWVTLPNNSSDYNVDKSLNLKDSPNGQKLFQDAMKSADPFFDFTNIQTVNFLLPKGQNVVNEGSQGFPWDEAVKNIVTNEGKIASYSIAGKFMESIGKDYWSYWAHEFGHAIGLPHIGPSRGELPPFNPWDIMGGQDGPSKELSGWLRFFAGWISDNKVYCKSINNLKNMEMTLIPLSSEDSGIKFIIIPVSEFKAVLIESRRVNKFSEKTPTSRDGTLVYLLDLTLGHGENFLVPVAPSERPKEQDIYKNSYSSDVLLHENDTVNVYGLTIKLAQSLNYDHIIISK